MMLRQAQRLHVRIFSVQPEEISSNRPTFDFFGAVEQDSSIDAPLAPIPGAALNCEHCNRQLFSYEAHAVCSQLLSTGEREYKKALARFKQNYG